MVTGVRKCVEIRCFNLHFYFAFRKMLASKCHNPESKVQWRWRQVFWRKLVKSTKSKDLLVTHKGFSSLTPSSQTPILPGSSFSVVFSSRWRGSMIPMMNRPSFKNAPVPWQNVAPLFGSWTPEKKQKKSLPPPTPISPPPKKKKKTSLGENGSQQQDSRKGGLGVRYGKKNRLFEQKNHILQGRSKNGDGFFSWLMGHEAEFGEGFLQLGFWRNLKWKKHVSWNPTEKR